MTYDDLVFEALSYRRHVGGSLAEIRSYVGVREQTRHSQRETLAVLARLEADGSIVKVGKRWYLTAAGWRRARGRALKPEWQGEDSWILLALLYHRARGPVGLRDLIGTADGINKAIPTREELFGALNRLLAGGLIKKDRDGFAVTTAAVRLNAKVVAACKRSLWDHFDGLARILVCPCCGVKLKAVRWRIDVDESAYREALQAYSASFRH